MSRAAAAPNRDKEKRFPARGRCWGGPAREDTRDAVYFRGYDGSKHNFKTNAVSVAAAAATPVTRRAETRLRAK